MSPTKQELPEHRTTVEIGCGIKGPGFHFAECRCGWAGPPRWNRKWAEENADKHQPRGQERDRG